MDNVKRIYVVDPGYSNFKIGYMEVDYSKKRIKMHSFRIPSAVSEFPDWYDSLYKGVKDSIAIEVNGRKYVVGQEALSVGVPIPTLSRGWLENIGCPLFIRRYCADFDELYLLLSVADWNKVERIKENIFSALPFPVEGRKIITVMQGTGIWIEAGSPGDVVVFDIGFNTVDVLISRYDEVEVNGRVVRKAVIPRELCFSLKEAGLVSFLEKINKDDPLRITGLLEFDDPDVVKLAREHYWEWLKTRLSARSEWRGIGSQVYRYIFGGGGARFLNLSEDEQKRSVIVKDPEMANVRGIMRLLARNLKREIVENRSSSM